MSGPSLTFPLSHLGLGSAVAIGGRWRCGVRGGCDGGLGLGFIADVPMSARGGDKIEWFI